MRDPLVLPLAAVVAGILLGRWLSFSIARSRLADRARSGAGDFRAWQLAACAPSASRLALVFAGTLDSRCIGLRPRRRSTPDLAKPCYSKAAWSSPPSSRPAASSSRWNWHWNGARSRESCLLKTTRARAAEARLRPARRNRSARPQPAQLQQPRRSITPRYLARQKIFWTATMPRGSQATVLPGRCGSRFMALVYRAAHRGARTARPALRGDSLLRPE